jgi:hypothetical protein
MLQSITIDKPELGLSQEWLIEYARTIDGSVFGDQPVRGVRTRLGPHRARL